MNFARARFAVKTKRVKLPCIASEIYKNKIKKIPVRLILGKSQKQANHTFCIINKWTDNWTIFWGNYPRITKCTLKLCFNVTKVFLIVFFAIPRMRAFLKIILTIIFGQFSIVNAFSKILKTTRSLLSSPWKTARSVLSFPWKYRLSKKIHLTKL